MGVSELKRLFKSIAKGVFTTTLRPRIGNYIIADIMTTLHSMSNVPLTLEEISVMLFDKLAGLLDDVPRTLIVIADKESMKPKQKAQEQKRRDDASMIEPYPDDSEITANGIVIGGTLQPRFSVSRVMRSRGQRKFLLREITRLFMRDPKVCLGKDFKGTVILDMVDGERPVSITSLGAEETHHGWLQLVGDFGEGDIGMLLYLREIKKAVSPPTLSFGDSEGAEMPTRKRKLSAIATDSETSPILGEGAGRAVPGPMFSLVTADSDVLPIFFGEFQRDPTLTGNWIGYRQEWCDMRILIDKLVMKGWNAHSCFLVACIGGCDFVAKSDLVHYIKFELVANTIHRKLKTGTRDPLRDFEAFDEMLMSVYTAWLMSQLGGVVKASSLRKDWCWVREALTHLPNGNRLKPPVDPNVRLHAYETAKWLRDYWNAK